MQIKNLSIYDFGRWLEDKIEAHAESRNVDLGWRFLSCPLKNIDTAKTVFIGINPGGRNKDIANDGLSVEVGSSYRIERWGGSFEPGKAPLQKQVLALFRLLSENPDQVLSGNLIPFRSPSIAELEDVQSVTAFGKELWVAILSRCPAKLIITMGNQVTKSIAPLLGITSLEKYPSGWGNVSIQVGEANGVLLIGIPHLSTFKLLSRPKCVEILKDILALKKGRLVQNPTA